MDVPTRHFHTLPPAPCSPPPPHAHPVCVFPRPVAPTEILFLKAHTTEILFLKDGPGYTRTPPRYSFLFKRGYRRATFSSLSVGRSWVLRDPAPPSLFSRPLHPAGYYFLKGPLLPPGTLPQRSGYASSRRVLFLRGGCRDGRVLFLKTLKPPGTLPQGTGPQKGPAGYKLPQGGIHRVLFLKAGYGTPRRVQTSSRW